MYLYRNVWKIYFYFVKLLNIYLLIFEYMLNKLLGYKIKYFINYKYIIN